jgi:hypothetical protein
MFKMDETLAYITRNTIGKLKNLFEDAFLDYISGNWKDCKKKL